MTSDDIPVLSYKDSITLVDHIKQNGEWDGESDYVVYNRTKRISVSGSSIGYYRLGKIVYHRSIDYETFEVVAVVNFWAQYKLYHALSDLRKGRTTYNPDINEMNRAISTIRDDVTPESEDI